MTDIDALIQRMNQPGHYLEDGIVRWWLDQHPGLRATESDVDADPAPVEGSGSGRPSEALSDERPTSQSPMTVDDIVTRAAEVLIEHTRTSIEACHCGWGKDPGTLGKSHAEHVARALDAAGLLRRPDDPQVDIEITRTGRTCVVKRSGQVIFDGVSLDALVGGRSLRAALGWDQ